MFGSQGAMGAMLGQGMKHGVRVVRGTHSYLIKFLYCAVKYCMILWNPKTSSWLTPWRNFIGVQVSKGVNFYEISFILTISEHLNKQRHSWEQWFFILAYCSNQNDFYQCWGYSLSNILISSVQTLWWNFLHLKSGQKVTKNISTTGAATPLLLISIKFNVEHL